MLRLTGSDRSPPQTDEGRTLQQIFWSLFSGHGVDYHVLDIIPS